MTTIRNLMLKLGLEVDSDSASKRINKVEKAILGYEKHLNRVTKIAAAGAGLGALGGAATALTAALVPASGAILALPSAFVATKIATATLKIGLMGVSDAMKAIGEKDAKKLNEALEKLSPNARKFVLASQGFAQSFEPIRRGVQDRLFEGLSGQMTPLANNLLPTTKKGMYGVATAFNSGAKEAAAFGRTDFARGSLNTVFDGTTQIMTTLAGAVQPALNIITRLAVAGIPLAKRMAEWATNGVKAASAFLTSKKGADFLTNAVDKAGDTLAQLGRIGANFAVGLISSLGTAKNEGVGVLDTLENLTAKFKTWAQSAHGQQGMTEFWALLRNILKQVSEVLPLLLGPFAALVKVIASLPPGVQGVVTQFAAWAIVLVPLSGKVMGLIGVVGGLIGIFGKMRAAITAVAASSVVSGMTTRLSGAFESLRSNVSAAEGPLNKFKTAVGGISGVASRARTALSGASGLLGGPWGIALAAGIGAVALFASRHQEAEERIREFSDAVKEDSGALGENTRAKVINRLESDGLLKTAQKLGINVKLFTDAALGNKDALAQVNTQLEKTTTGMQAVGGRGASTATQWKTMSGEAKFLSGSLNDTNSELAQSVQAYNRTTTALGQTKGAINPVVAGNNQIAVSADKAAIKTDNLTRKLSAFNDKAADADLAAIDFKESLNRLSDAITKGNNGISKKTGLFNINTTKGRENNRMVIDAIRAAADHADKLVKQGRSVDYANRQFQNEIGKLRGVLSQMGLSRGAIDKLIAKYADMAKKINNSTNGIKDRRVKIHVNADGTVNLPGGTKASIFAKGGILPGYTPGRDVHYFHSPDGNTIGLSGGEAVMRPEFTRGAGAQWVEEMNYIARTGGPTAVREALGPMGTRGPGNKHLGAEGMFFANGGIIHQDQLTGLAGVQKMLSKYDSKISAWTWSAVQKITKRLNELGIGGPKVQKALTWAKKQAGKPYIWAGVGPGGYDCSGFMGSIYAVIKGLSPHQRYFSTHSFGAQSGPGGFKRNAQSGFKVGVTNAGVGHMAGTLGKTNVESSGSRGVRVGGGARGYNNGLFPYRYGLRMDDGGILPPRSVTPVYNGTNKPEYAIPQKYMKGEGDTINITIHAGIGTDPRALENAVYDALKQYKRRNGRRLNV